MKRTLAQVAEATVKQNTCLTKMIKDNPGKNFKLVEAAIRPLMRTIGTAVGTYVPRNSAVWAIIDHVEGKTKSNAKALKLNLD